MNQARIEGYTNELGRNQGYKPLYVRKTPVTDTVSAVPSVLQEIEMLIKGAKIHVGLLTSNHPPIKVTVGPVPDERVET
jgi:hypothetical protein